MLQYYDDLMLTLLANCCSGRLAHFAIHVYDAMNTPFSHGLTIVNMLRRKGAILAKKHFYEEKCHSDSNY